MRDSSVAVHHEGIKNMIKITYSFQIKIETNLYLEFIYLNFLWGATCSKTIYMLAEVTL